MVALSRDGLSLDKLEEVLGKYAGQLDVTTRERMVEDLITMKSAAPKDPIDPLIAAATHAVGFTFDYANMPADLHNFGPWSRQYVVGIEAVKLVLEFLQAQENMDLFSTNRAAKQLYQAIIRAGCEKVLCNR